MPKIQIPKPSPKQQKFIDDRHKHLGYGGARGGGKSWAVRVGAILLSAQYPGYTSMIVRKSYPELQANHIKPLCEMLKCHAPAGQRFAKYNDAKKEITFPNGSQILFRYCEKDKDADRFQGTECDALFIDEATHQSEERVKKLTACVRGTNSFPKLIRYTCNPGGEGHEWVKRIFLDRRFQDGEDPEDYAFIQASVYDNKALLKEQPDYIKQLEALPPRLREMWLHGNWDVYLGQFFEDLRVEPDVFMAHDAGCEDDRDTLRREHRWCHVIEPFEIPKGWKIMRSYDFGYGKPFSCGWWAISYDGVMYRIHELYGCTKTANEGVRWTPDKQFSEIARIEKEHPLLAGRKIEGVADPSIWDGSRGETINDAAIRHGVIFSKGDNARIPGWMQCHYRLQFDENGYARVYIFNTCTAFIRTIPTLIYDEHIVEDLDTDLEDHVADEWRYAMMSRPISPIMPEAPKPVYYDPLNQFTKKRR